MASTAVLEVSGVGKRYGNGPPALDGVDLCVAAGEVCGLLGPNGAGKTTLVSIIAGLRRPDEGSVAVAGIDVATGGAAARRLVGLAAQETGIYPMATVRANLELFVRLSGVSGGGVARRIDEVAEVVELGPLLDRQARHLSGGEKRRLHTAMALVHQPPLLLLDEPTTGVDIATRARLLEAIGELAPEHGCAVLYSTHYLPEIEEMGASVAVLDRGRLLARGTLDELIDRHGSGLVELSFHGEAPAFDHLVDPAALTVDGATVRIRTDRPAAMAAEVMAGLGADADRLAAVELARPSLDTVFLALTGRAYRADDEGDYERDDEGEVDGVGGVGDEADGPTAEEVVA